MATERVDFASLLPEPSTVFAGFAVLTVEALLALRVEPVLLRRRRPFPEIVVRTMIGPFRRLNSPNGNARSRRCSHGTH